MLQDDTARDMRGTVRLSGALICASQEERDIIAAHLSEHVRLTRLETGCLSFTVTQSDDPMIWTVAERFTDEQAFASHQVRTRASTWGSATKAIRRDYEISTVTQ
jgi:quinol monooxygenase YgiN